MALQELEKWQSLPICLAVVDDQDSAFACEFACPAMCSEDYEPMTAAAAVSA